MLDTTLLILLGLAALGFASHSTTVAISILVLIIVRHPAFSTFFPWIEKRGLTIGIIILTIGVVAPHCQRHTSLNAACLSTLNWKSLLAIGVNYLFLAGAWR